MHSSTRAVSTQGGLALVSPGRRDKAASERPRVYDIAAARAAQRMHRPVFRPIAVQRRAKVLRFHEAEARAAVYSMPRWTPRVNGPYDLPPAA
ncbi:MAG: hypothetical protein ACLGSD_16365 [Acidobacteriota bacterium]